MLTVSEQNSTKELSIEQAINSLLEIAPYECSGELEAIHARQRKLQTLLVNFLTPQTTTLEQLNSLAGHQRFTYSGLKTIIAGSRSVTKMVFLRKALVKCGWNISTVVSGCAQGADELGERYAQKSGLGLERFPAEWGLYGKKAGYMRNITMAQNAHALIALWDGQSRGTKHMIDIAVERGLKVYVYRTDIDKGRHIG